ncbi:hypothetical protein Tco_0282540, partial [Tanacetum coccineum]
VGDLSITVTRDVADASTKIDGKNDGSRVLGLSHEELAKRNLIKGGYTIVVKVDAEVNWDGKPIPQDIDVEDQPEGGANALNVNRNLWTKYVDSETEFVQICNFGL